MTSEVEPPLEPSEIELHGAGYGRDGAVIACEAEQYLALKDDPVAREAFIKSLGNVMAEEEYNAHLMDIAKAQAAQEEQEQRDDKLNLLESKAIKRATWQTLGGLAATAFIMAVGIESVRIFEAFQTAMSRFFPY